MTPDEHAAKAEELLDVATRIHDDLQELADTSVGKQQWDRSVADLNATALLAQVHATLSLRQPKTGLSPAAAKWAEEVNRAAPPTITVEAGGAQYVDPLTGEVKPQ